MKENKKTKNLKTLDQLIKEEFGPIGTKARDKFEKGFKAFERSFLDNKRKGIS
ncbi:hypothetical protein CLV31_103200 [Algoriphagus aquaeductus]|uniref:Uncharacterized protein n=1 Tax=Algoriphagus aquaeductus TaxID=475299 RepID=A0A326RYA5_9BACT|nr:hypothetical protein CLV31_103200 [Algoriphagus aquaeductus]